MSSRESLPFSVMEQIYDNHDSRSTANFWLLIISIILIIVFIIVTTVFIILPALKIKDDVEKIDSSIKPVKSNIDKLEIAAGAARNKIEGFSADIASDLEDIFKDKQQIKDLFIGIENLSKSGSEDVDNLIFDFCNLTIQSSDNSRNSFIMRDKSAVNSICRDVLRPPIKGGTLLLPNDLVNLLGAILQTSG